MGAPVLATAGTFPERAFVLTPEYTSCTTPGKNVVRRWNGKRWVTVTLPGPDGWPREQSVDLCNWGQHELALRLSRWYDEPVTARFEVIDDKSVAPPVLEPAPNTDAYSKHHCESRLLPERCVGLASGGIVVAGSWCDETGPAVEFFPAGSVAGTTFKLPLAEAPDSFQLTNVIVNDDVTYFAGRQGSPQRAYLARFSPASGAELVPLPEAAKRSLIRDLVATRDASLWMNASPAAEHDGVVALGLWRRDPSGTWHRQSLPPDVPDRTGHWVLSPAPNNNLAGAWGQVWFNATFYNGDPTQPGTLSQDLILAARSNLVPLVRHKGRSRPSSPNPAITVPCGP